LLQHGIIIHLKEEVMKMAAKRSKYTRKLTCNNAVARGSDVHLSYGFLKRNAGDIFVTPRTAGERPKPPSDWMGFYVRIDERGGLSSTFYRFDSEEDINDAYNAAHQ
jgi:hypothetical protein